MLQKILENQNGVHYVKTKSRDWRHALFLKLRSGETSLKNENFILFLALNIMTKNAC